MCPEEDDPRPAAEGEEERRLPAHLTKIAAGALCCYRNRLNSVTELSVASGRLRFSHGDQQGWYAPTECTHGYNVPRAVPIKTFSKPCK